MLHGLICSPHVPTNFSGRGYSIPNISFLHLTIAQWDGRPCPMALYIRALPLVIGPTRSHGPRGNAVLSAPSDHLRIDQTSGVEGQSRGSSPK